MGSATVRAMGRVKVMVREWAWAMLMAPPKGSALPTWDWETYRR